MFLRNSVSGSLLVIVFQILFTLPSLYFYLVLERRLCEEHKDRSTVISVSIVLKTLLDYYTFSLVIVEKSAINKIVIFRK